MENPLRLLWTRLRRGTSATTPATTASMTESTTSDALREGVETASPTTARESGALIPNSPSAATPVATLPTLPSRQRVLTVWMPHLRPDAHRHPDGHDRISTTDEARPADYREAWTAILAAVTDPREVTARYENAFTATFFSSLAQQGFSGSQIESTDGTIRVAIDGTVERRSSQTGMQYVGVALQAARKAGVEEVSQYLYRTGLDSTDADAVAAWRTALLDGAPYAEMTLFPTLDDPAPRRWDDVALLPASSRWHEFVLSSGLHGVIFPPDHATAWRDGTTTGHATGDVGIVAPGQGAITALDGVTFGFLSAAGHPAPTAI